MNANAAAVQHSAIVIGDISTGCLSGIGGRPHSLCFADLFSITAVITPSAISWVIHMSPNSNTAHQPASARIAAKKMAMRILSQPIALRGRRVIIGLLVTPGSNQ